METVQHNAPHSLLSLLDEISTSRDEDWGLIRVKKAHLKPITNDAFLHAVRPAMLRAKQTFAFFLEKRIFLIWQGDKKVVYKQLRAQIATALAQPGVSIDPAIMATYIDPLLKGKELKAALQAEGDSADRLFEEAESEPLPRDMDGDDTNGDVTDSNQPNLSITHAQTEQFSELCKQKPYRSNLQFLVVEDQTFSQKLLCEILRSARTRNNNETPLIDTAQGIQEAWKLYLKKAHNIVFIDLGLIDGSGHTLARTVKELDPTSYVIIITANNFPEEFDVARQNNVDGFIAKPYNKKQILDSVDRYMSTLKGLTKGNNRGAVGQSR